MESVLYFEKVTVTKWFDERIWCRAAWISSDMNFDFFELVDLRCDQIIYLAGHEYIRNQAILFHNRNENNQNKTKLLETNNETYFGQKLIRIVFEFCAKIFNSFDIKLTNKLLCK